MTWSTIYSIELKYKLTVKPSLVNALCWSAFILVNLLLVVILCSTLLLPLNSLTDKSQIFIIFIVLLVVFVCWRVFVQIRKQQKVINYQLSEQGQLMWVNENSEIENWQISPASRVALYGCYLTLIDNQQTRDKNPLSAIPKEATFEKLASVKLFPEKSKTKQQFIFKDSLTSTDYARLCRVIRHLNFEPDQQVLK